MIGVVSRCQASTVKKNTEFAFLLKRTEVLFGGCGNGLVGRGLKMKLEFPEQNAGNSARFCLSLPHFSLSGVQIIEVWIV